MSLHSGKRALTQPRVERFMLCCARVADLRASELSVTTGSVTHSAILAPLCRLASMRSHATPHAGSAKRSVAARILKTPLDRVSPMQHAHVGGS